MGILTLDIRDFVNRQKLGYVATVCPDGSPNLSPKGTIRAWDDRHLIFADIHSPGTVENLQLNPAIEINVVDIFTRRGFRFKGEAEIYSHGILFDEITLDYRNAGSRHNIKHIVWIKVTELQAMWSPAYDTDKSEEEITRYWVNYWHNFHPHTPEY